MRALYGIVPPKLVNVPMFGRVTEAQSQIVYDDMSADLTQCSPLVPGSEALEEVADRSVERFLVHAPRGTLDRRYVLAQALRTMRRGATLVALAGNKLGGTRLSGELKMFGCVVEEAAQHHHRVCTAVVPESPAGIDEAIAAGGPRFVEDIGLWSQPGIFSWDRIDAATALLVQNLPTLSGRGADLGCGIGVLAMAALAHPGVAAVTLVDIDRRALAAAKRNVTDARAAFRWSDAASDPALPTGLDFVLANPPFHDADGSTRLDLGRALVARAAALLRPGGRLLMVANRHLAYEAEMKPMFRSVRQLAQTSHFKVCEAVR